MVRSEVIHGEPDAIRAIATQIENAANTAMSELLRVGANLEGMPGESTWDDPNHRSVFERYEELRSNIKNDLTSLLYLAAEVHGLAVRYESLLG